MPKSPFATHACAWLLCGTVAARLVCAPAAFAGRGKKPPRRPVPRKAPLSHQVVIADQLVMTIDAAPPGSTPARRVDAINERLIEIIATEPLLPERMRLVSQRGEAVIVVGRHSLVSVTAADARANGTTVPVLAHFWLANLKKALPQARPVVRKH